MTPLTTESDEACDSEHKKAAGGTSCTGTFQTLKHKRGRGKLETNVVTALMAKVIEAQEASDSRFIKLVDMNGKIKNGERRKADEG